MAIAGWKDSALFTPGPLTTSCTVKQSMLRDLGSRDSEFLQITQDVRKKLLRIAEVGDDYTTVLMQGSGTFGVESVVSSVVPPQGRMLILTNGAYGDRMAQMAKTAKIDCHVLRYPENRKPDPSAVAALFEKDPTLTHLGMIHCETTSGIFNPIEEIGQICTQHGKVFIVDAMSSFGGMPISFSKCKIDYLIASSNKCLEGVPGLAFVIARKSELEKTKGFARSLSLDLYSQWKGLESAGEFRFTPPIQVLLALHQALVELEDEGGVLARSARYQENHSVLMRGMTALGFKTYLESADLGYIITSFRYPEHPRFVYKDLYEKLQRRGFVIYSGKVTDAECFRIGNIGRLFTSDVTNMLSAMRETLAELGVELRG